jgi:hypothetical protein
MPPQLTQFCSVVASANDSSSHNIYIYGGYAGLNSGNDTIWDDVYILSMPSFTWVKAFSGGEENGRYGHRCVKPYPDQMFVVGGYVKDAPDKCVDGVVQVFNLNTLSFQDSYDPKTWSYYDVPSAVTKVIGGEYVYLPFLFQSFLTPSSGQGGAINFSPKTWGDQALSNIFSANYTGTPQKVWYPYTPQNSSNSTLPTPVPTHNGGGIPHWVGPVLGVVLGLVFFSAIAAFWMLWRRRQNMKHRQSASPSETTTSRNARNPVWRWLNGMQPPPQQPPKPETTVTSSEVGDAEKPQSPIGSPIIGSPTNTFEMAGAPRYEVHGVSAAVELPTNYNQTQPTSPSSPHSLYSATTGLPSPISPAVLPASRGSSPTPDPSASPSQIPSRNSSHPTRPTHHRNFSSLSSGVDLGPSVTDEEDQRRSQYLAELPSPGSSGSPVSPDRLLSADPAQMGSGRARTGKSSFGEMLDEGDEHQDDKK